MMKKILLLAAALVLSACANKYPPSYYSNGTIEVVREDSAYDRCIALIVERKQYINCPYWEMKSLNDWENRGGAK